MKEKPQLFNLQRYQKVGGNYRHISTDVWGVPYAICKWQKKLLENNFSTTPLIYFKVVKA